LGFSGTRPEHGHIRKGFNLDGQRTARSTEIRTDGHRRTDGAGHRNTLEWGESFDEGAREVLPSR
jgi:hypothetical protein